MDVENIVRRGYFRTLAWWPFLLLLVVAFVVDLLVKAGLHQWSFRTDNVISAVVGAVLTWLFFAGLWRYMVRREQRKS
ncbi:hypothetical protein [Amycolatopsis sp. cmx-8-4]|uniref:hypothetical protein n=1 Tax=Amycolatopsis sp. cmx-8-4 TaxID=2790947 RepID=UPI00397A2441